MVKVKKGNVSYTIPESQVLLFKYRGFEIVEEAKQEVVIEKEEIVEEIPAIVEEDVEKPALNLWQMKTVDLVNLAVEKGISLTGTESRKEIIEKLK